MRKNRLLLFLPFIIIAVFSENFISARTASADIYMRVGKDGTVYFSNVPVSQGYRVYMRTKRPEELSGGIKSASPTAYKKIIIKASRKYSVAPSLIEAVIRAESGYNSNAVSYKGAEGLMQLMPRTQRLVKVSDPFNASQNINGGTRYLKSLIIKYNGNLPLAVAAYNAGSGAVDKYGGIPPYGETRNYVEEVMDYYRENGTAGK